MERDPDSELTIRLRDLAPAPVPPPIAGGSREERHRLRELTRAALKADPLFDPAGELSLDRLTELGRGGMSIVYRALDRRLKREVALKVVGDAANPDDLERFRREVKATARLEHPSIPPVYNAGMTADGDLYMVMRLVVGETLEARIKRFHAEGGALDAPQLRELLEVVARVADGLAFAHSRGVIHRDVKPANVMLGEFGEVYVMDWGLARDFGGAEAGDGRAALTPTESVSGKLTDADAIIGTAGYMPPEQAAGMEVDDLADVFAIGAVLCELLTGRPPIEGETKANRLVATIRRRIATPRSRRHEVPEGLDGIAARALHHERAERTQSAKAFAAELRGFLARPTPARRGFWGRLRGR